MFYQCTERGSEAVWNYINIHMCVYVYKRQLWKKKDEHRTVAQIH